MLLAILLACTPKSTPPAAAVPAPETAVPAAAAGELAPRPFTPEQIAAEMPVGTVIRYRIDMGGKPAYEERWDVVGATPEGCTIASKQFDLTSGELVLDEGEETTPWAELAEHASFPASATTLSDAEVTLPAGTFPAKQYVVRQGTTVSTYHFVRPGPPVSLVQVENGVEVFRMSLLERK